MISRNHVAGVIGNVLEWYDFTIFGFLAPIIGPNFFPSDNPVVSQLSAFGVFAVGYMMRPLAGVIYGYIGDRFGRKRALQFSMVLMAIPTSLLGLLPTYASIGIAAPILLVILRMLQGLSVAGEFVGSMTFISEIAPPRRRAFFGSWTVFSALAGCMLGSAAGALAHLYFSKETLDDWGWRVPFFAGVVLGGGGFWLRAGMTETAQFEKSKTESGTGKPQISPLVDALRTQPGIMIRLGGLVILSTGIFTELFVWWPTYLTHFVTPPVPHAMVINTISLCVLMALIPAGGIIADLIGHRRMMMLSSGALVLTGFPLVLWITRGDMVSVLIAQCLFALVMCGFMATLPAAMAEMFPTRLRFTASGVGFNISASIFGGTAPFVCTWLIQSTKSLFAPAFYLVGLAALSFLSAWGVRTDQLPDR